MNTAKGLLFSGLCIASSAHAVNDMMLFLKGLLRNPLQVGALMPCSEAAVNEITRHISHACAANAEGTEIRVLEVGAGPGTCTGKIVELLEGFSGNYHFDVIEIDPKFCEILRNRFGNNPCVTIHCIDATAWEPIADYDFIVSTLPFTNLSTDAVSDVLAMYRSIIKEGGVVTYVELFGFIPLNKLVLHGKSRKDFITKLERLADFKKDFILDTVKVWRNVPPIYIHHLVFLGGQESDIELNGKN